MSPNDLTKEQVAEALSLAGKLAGSAEAVLRSTPMSLSRAVGDLHDALREYNAFQVHLVNLHRTKDRQ